MTPMKIGVYSSTVFPCPPAGYAGLEMIAYQQARGLAARGHDVTLFAPDGSSCPGGAVFPLGPPGHVSEKQAYSGAWPELLKQDVIIDSSWQKFAYSLKAEGRLKAPVLGVLHAPVNTMMGSLPPNVDKPCFVCISEDQGAHFRALFSRDCRVAMNGVDPAFYKPTGVPRSGRFLFLARFSTIKGPLLAIQACKEAGAGLDLVGDTSITNEPEYFAQCKALCDGTQIKMVGPATRGECVAWFSQAHALIHPVRDFREPFGLAPVEAQLCGCPVIAWDNGACRETIDPEATGWLVRSADELAFWVRDVGNSSIALGPGGGLRDRCRTWALKFSEDAMVARYLALCEEAVNGGGW